MIRFLARVLDFRPATQVCIIGCISFGLLLGNPNRIFAQIPSVGTDGSVPTFVGSPITSDTSSNPSIGVYPAPMVPSQGLELGNGFIALTSEEAIHVSIYDRCNRGVVNISTTSLRPESLLLSAEVEGNGSGIILNKQGHILTNYHVISGSQKITVKLFNLESYPAVLVGQDPDNDIAVLQIDAPETVLFPIPWGDSGNLRVGQHIIAIGNPFGLERTMTTGIISSLNREITSKTKRRIHSIIQIDAALNQGNSGGPLLNLRGELIGMNTAIATRSGDNAGIGFAIPINTINRVVTQLLTTGRVSRPTIGIGQAFETDRGLLVVSVTPDGPAARAGIRGSKIARRKGRVGMIPVETSVVDHSEADLIIGIDGQKVRTRDDLLSIIEAKKPGDQVVLSLARNGQMAQIPVILGGND
jgi:S1-C subfamily serine protease